MFLLVLRLVSLGRSPLVRFALPLALRLCLLLALLLSCLPLAVLFLPAVGYALVLPAVGFAPLPAVGFALPGSLHHCSRSSMFFSCSPRTLVALLHSLHHWLVGCGSVSDSLWKFTTPWFVSGFHQHHHSALRHFVIEGSQQMPSIHEKAVNNVFCFCVSGLRGSLYLLLVGVLQYHCVMLWAVSTLITKAFIATPVTAWSFGSSGIAGLSLILDLSHLSCGTEITRSMCN